MADKALCSIQDCSKTSLARGLCANHYQLWRKRDVVRKIAPDGAGFSFAQFALSSDTKTCVVWPFRCVGVYPVITTPEGIKIQAHRYVCAQTNGPSTKARPWALHDCGNNKCINPKHLYWGTPKENQADRTKHGTDNLGARHALSKLTEDQARIAKYDRSKSVKELAKLFNVRPCTIYAVREGRNWRHI